MTKRLLIISDNEAMARLLRDTLVYKQSRLERAATTSEAQRKLKSFDPDVVLLDLMLAKGDGLDICHALGAQRERPLIIIFSLRSSKDDKVLGLNLRADYCAMELFAAEELLASITAVMRHLKPSVNELHLGQAVVNFRTHTATRRGHALGLSDKEFDVLQYLADHLGRFVTRDELLQEVWGYRHLPLTRSVDILIARLRGKLEVDPHHPRFICTVHGGGYKLIPKG